MKKDTIKSMFGQIQQSMASQTSQGSNEYLRFEKGKTYEVRILPYLKDPTKTFFQYFKYTWKSFSTGALVNAVSPKIPWGLKDPIGEMRFKAYNGDDEAAKAKSQSIYRSEKWVCNVYVVKDPTNSENEGTVKRMSYGKQIAKIISSAVEGEDSDQFGHRVFDLTSDGCSLRIKCEDQGGFANYTTSKFLMPAAIAGLDDDDIDEIYEQAIDTHTIVKPPSEKDLHKLLNEHYYADSASEEEDDEEEDDDIDEPSNVFGTSNVINDDDDDDDIPMTPVKKDKASKRRELLDSLDDED